MLKMNNESVPLKRIKSLYELYQLSQLIQEATRVTVTSSTLIDHIVTNSPEKVLVLQTLKILSRVLMITSQMLAQI